MSQIELDEHLLYAMNLLQDGHEEQSIAAALNKRGLGPDHVQELIARVKRFRQDRRRKRGTTLIGIGSLFLFLGFLLTMMLSYSDPSFHYTLYGFTMLGILLVILGMADVMG